MTDTGASEGQLAALGALFDRGPVAVLTGAGISTESGIPDYRGPETRRRARSPMQYGEFFHSEAARQRYWARSLLGFPRMRAALPNRGHAALVRLQAGGRLSGLITQNVDGLHRKAGSVDDVELHGSLAFVVCLACGARQARDWLQGALTQANPGFASRLRPDLAPDGDSDLSPEEVLDFRVVSCACGGALKPDVVFFGENVPRARVAVASAMVDAASALLVVGSSLAVYSGLRFVHQAKKRGLPVACLTLGETRADTLFDLRLDAAAGPTLSALAACVLGLPPPALDAQLNLRP